MRRYLFIGLILFNLALILLTILTMATAGHAQDSPRHIDFTQVLKDLDGKPLPMNADGKLPSVATLGYVAKEALVNTIQGDPPDGGPKNDHWKLADKIYPDKSAVELCADASRCITMEEVATIKERIGKGFPALVVGPAWKMLDAAVYAPVKTKEGSK